MWRQWYDWMVIWVMYFVENRYEPIRISAPAFAKATAGCASQRLRRT